MIVGLAATAPRLDRVSGPMAFPLKEPGDLRADEENELT
jgi:hypothetical protein